MGTLRNIGRRTVPAGLVLGVTAAAVLTAASPAFAAAYDATLTTTNGPAGGGNTVVVTATGQFTGPLVPGTSLFFQFQRKSVVGTACAADYQTGAALTGVVAVPTPNVTGVTANDATILVPAGVDIPAGQTSADYNICGYADATTGALLAATIAGATTAYHVVPKLTLSAQNGPAAGGNTLTMTAPVGSTAFDGTFGVQFQAASPAAGVTNYCTASWAATATVSAGATPAGVVPVAASDIGIVAGNKIVVPVPTNLGNSLALGFHVCVFDGVGANPNAAAADTTKKLILGSGSPYTVGTPATITSVTPAAGPAQGGNTITVVGTGFASGLTVSLAGVPLTPVNAVGTTSFQVVMPPRAAGGPYKLSVTTGAGTTTTAAGVYSYSNGIKIQPNTATNTKTTKTWMSVSGIGFGEFIIPASSTNGATPNGSGPHVYLVKGAYDPKPVAGTKANGQSAECVDVLVISDTELVCGLYLAGNNANAVTRTFAGCAAAAIAATTIGIPANTACVFTVNDIGMTITSNSAGSIVGNTVITAVTPPNGSTAGTVTLSKALAAAIAVTTPTFTVSSARVVEANGIQTTNTIAATAATGPFAATDVGKRIAGANIPANTTITGVTNGVATLSATPTGATVGATNVTLTTPVPVGTYTLTVVNNGALNASVEQSSTYIQSIISSGSTFTVAEY